MRFRTFLPVSLSMSLLLGGWARAQQPDALAAAAELFRQSKWAEAAKAYADITARDPRNGAAWSNLGESLLELHKPLEAAEAFQQAVQAGFRPVLNQVNAARAYAVAHERGKVLALLQQVVDSGNGGRMRPIILGFQEFSGMSGDPDFQTLLEKMRPCLTAEYHQFDFWAGDWDVQVQGQTAGHNLVTVEQDGCLLVEHWKASSGGQTGTSFNYYDVRDKMWHQLYLDNSGNAGAFPALAGNLVGGRMVLLTDANVSPVYRWTWYVMAPGRVRQMAEQSSDGQKTWNTVWDSVYVRGSEKH